MMFDAFWFITFLLLFVYIPGRSVLNLLQKDEIGDTLVSLGLRLSVGIVLITLVSLVVRYVGLPWWNLRLMGAVAAFELVGKRHIYSSEFANLYRAFVQQPVVTVVLVLATLAQCLTLLSGGTNTNNGIRFPALHDSMWNLALVGELKHHVPPQHPGMSGVQLKNNHFLYPLFLATIESTTPISKINLYYRFAPLLVGLLFGLSLYSVSTLFTRSKNFLPIYVFLGYFCGNFAFMAPFFFGRDFDWHSSIFYADQPFDQMTNPYTVLGFVFFLFGLYGLYHLVRQIRLLKLWLGVVVILWGTLFGFKSFGAVIAILTLFIVSGYMLIRQGRKWLIVPAVFSTVCVPIFWLINSKGEAGLQWAPGWLLSEMMSSRDKLNQLKFADIEQYYRAIHNWLGLAKIKTIELAVYLVGNLGVRIIGVAYMFWVLLQMKATQARVRLLFTLLLISSSIAIAIPLLFNLKGNAHNIIQFTPYGLLLLTFPTATILESFVRKRGSRLRLFTVCTVMLVLFIAVITNIKNIYEKFGTQVEILSFAELSALDFMRNNSRSDDFIVINPNQYTTRSPIYISALTERRLFVDPYFARQTLDDPQTRLTLLSSFFANRQPDDFLNSVTPKYIYLLKWEMSKSVELLLQNPRLVSVFENDSLIIVTPKTSN